MRHMLIFVALLMAFSATAQSQNHNADTTSQSSSDEQAVMQLSQDLAKAFFYGEVSTLERLLADDYKSITSDGVILSKEKILERASIDLNAVFPERKFKLLNISAKVIGDAAIVYSTYEFKFKARNEDQKTYYSRLTDMFVKPQDNWQMITSHESQVPTWMVREMEDNELEPIASLDCQEETNLNSTDGDVVTLLRFKNETNQQVKIYWLGFAGQRDKEWLVAPKESRDMTTFLTHPFVVVGENEECMGIYLPTQEPALAVIKEN